MNLNILKKNQIVLFVIALMVITAGYLNYTLRGQEVVSNSIEGNELAALGDAKLVSNDNIIEDVYQEEGNQIAQETVAEVKTTTDSQSTSTKQDDYFATSRLGRDTMYSQMIENYQKLLENQNISQEQKTIATQEITNINNVQNSIMICENLIKTKGIDDVVIFVNEKSINVIIKSDNLEQEKIAQVQNIIAREMNAEIENIHISNK